MWPGRENLPSVWPRQGGYMVDGPPAVKQHAEVVSQGVLHSREEPSALRQCPVCVLFLLIFYL
jgi:hypothetical protein